MLLFSNVMNISYVNCVTPLSNIEEPLKDHPYLTTAYILSIVLRDTSFNESHWIFSAKYYGISRFMPYVISQEDVPESVFKYDRVTNIIFLYMNLIFPVLSGVAYFFDASELHIKYPKPINLFLMTSRCCIVIL
jgi:hypothetical protein